MTLGTLTDKTELQTNNGMTVKALKEVLCHKVDRDELDHIIKAKANIEDVLKGFKGQELIKM